MTEKIKRMIINLFLTIILGVVIGTFTGLVPGIHINLLGAVFFYIF
jgi:TctA family transporter